MFSHLQIADPRERWLVGCADLALSALTAPGRLVRRRETATPPGRVLLLRAERIGDLIMTRAAIAEVRRRAPHATIDLVVGSWNLPLARLLPGPDRVEALDLPWLTRGHGAASWPRAVRTASRWRSRRYDLAINFEGDVRSHLLLALSAARRRVGFAMAGGGALLTDVVAHDPRRHTSANALRLVERAFGEGPHTTAGTDPAGSTDPADRLVLPAHVRRHARALLETARNNRSAAQPAPSMLIGLHAGGARAVKQWPPERFVDVAGRLARRYGATIVLTGADEDAEVNGRVRSLLPPDAAVVDLTGQGDLLTLAAILEQLDLVIAVDSGPMHIAAAMGTPLVAVFGPSDPARWGPDAPDARPVRVDLPCSPCNRVRRPPARCVGHVPDCLAGVAAADVFAQAVSLLDGRSGPQESRP